jgi:hypothetical protein
MVTFANRYILTFLCHDGKTCSAGIDKLEQEGILRDNQRHEHALR